MPIYLVEWKERTPHRCRVEADSKEEAIEKMLRDEFIHGTQDSDPGDTDNRTIKARIDEHFIQNENYRRR